MKKHKSQPIQHAQFSIRVPDNLLTIIDNKAAQQKRSRNQIVILMIEQALSYEERKTC